MRIVRRHKPYRDGWNEVEQDEMWIHAHKGSWTGITINNPKPRIFHVRFYPQTGHKKDYDVGTRTTLRAAQSLSQRCLNHVV